MPASFALILSGNKNICPENCELWKDARLTDFSDDGKMSYKERGAWTNFSGPEWKIFLKENLACGYEGRPKAVKRSFTKERAEKWAVDFGVKNVWTVGKVEAESEAETIEKEWDVGDIGPPDKDDECSEYRYQILYLIKVFAVEYYKNLKWVKGEVSYDRKVRREAVADPIETAYVVCRCCCDKKHSYVPPAGEPSSLMMPTVVIQDDGSIHIKGDMYGTRLAPDDSGYVKHPQTGEFIHTGFVKHPQLGKFVRI